MGQNISCLREEPNQTDMQSNNSLDQQKSKWNVHAPRETTCTQNKEVHNNGVNVKKRSQPIRVLVSTTAEPEEWENELGYVLVNAKGERIVCNNSLEGCEV